METDLEKQRSPPFNVFRIQQGDFFHVSSLRALFRALKNIIASSVKLQLLREKPDSLVVHSTYFGVGEEVSLML